MVVEIKHTWLLSALSICFELQLEDKVNFVADQILRMYREIAFMRGSLQFQIPHSAKLIN